MIFKKLHKNKFINLGLLILLFLIVAYFYKNYYFNKRKEGLANNCPEGCVKDDSIDGNCHNGVCPMICPYPDIGGSGCQYDSDCSGCPTSRPGKHHKPHGTHTIGGDPATWSPNSIIDGNNSTPSQNLGGNPSTWSPNSSSQSNNSMTNSSNTRGNNWSQIGTKVGKLIGESFDQDNNNIGGDPATWTPQSNNKHHHHHHGEHSDKNIKNNNNGFLSDLQNDWNNLVGGN